jgi:hypothetical protein
MLMLIHTQSHLLAAKPSAEAARLLGTSYSPRVYCIAIVRGYTDAVFTAMFGRRKSNVSLYAAPLASSFGIYETECE